jgi:MFS family permease
LEGTVSRTKFRPYLVVLLAVACALYTVSQFLRNSVGVIAPDLAAETGVVAGELGILSGVFFFSFALAQIPVGMALDRFGPRISTVALIGLAVAGCGLFASAQGLWGFTAARVLMGLGCAVLLMGPFILFTLWFPSRQFASLVGIILSAGNAGALLATAPLARAAAAFGWRETFLAVAVITAVMGIIAWIVFRDAPEGSAFHDRPKESFKDSFRGVREVVRVRHFWPVFWAHFFGYSVFVTLFGLWGGPYLSDVHGAGLAQRGNILLVMALAQIIGLIAWGPLDRLLDSRKRPILAGMAGSAAIITALAIWPAMPVMAMTVLFALYGLICAFMPLVFAHGRHLFPQHLVGRGITVMNMAAMGGVFVLQLISGFVISAANGLSGRTEPTGNALVAYQALFGAIAIALIAAMVIYSRAADSRPSQD